MAGPHRGGPADSAIEAGHSPRAEGTGLDPVDTEVEPQTLEQLIDWVCQQGPRLDFYRALLLLQQAFPQAARFGEDGPAELEALRLRASVDLAFPAADLEAIERVGGRVRVAANFLGLYGVDSPLPVVYAERIARSQVEPEGRRTRDFLDVFQHRLYGLLFRAWKRSRPVSLTGKPDLFYDHVLSLVGYSQRLAIGGSPAPRLIEARLQIMRARTARGLELLLRLRLKRPLRVKALQDRRVALPAHQLGRLGRERSALSSELLLGRNAYDRNAVRICLALKRYADWIALMPGGAARRELDQGVDAYVRDPAAYQVQLTLPAAEVPPWPLGRGDGRVGRNVWLGRPRQRAQTVWHNG